MSTTIEQIREAVNRTREARERVRQHRSTDAVVAALAQTAKNWLDPNSPWRKRAVEQAPAPTGFSEAMVREAIDLIFGAITYESLGELLDREWAEETDAIQLTAVEHHLREARQVGGGGEHAGVSRHAAHGPRGGVVDHAFPVG